MREATNDCGAIAPASAGNQCPLVLKPGIHKMLRAPSRLKQIMAGLVSREGEDILSIHSRIHGQDDLARFVGLPGKHLVRHTRIGEGQYLTDVRP